MNIKIINSFEREKLTIINYAPLYTTYALQLEHEDGNTGWVTIFGESYWLCLDTLENRKKLERLKEIDRLIKELQQEGYGIVRNMDDIINTSKFREILFEEKLKEGIIV